MKAIPFEGANKTNKSQREGECDLPSYTDGLAHVTKWQFTKEELQYMLEHDYSFYMVGVFGVEHPAVGMTVENPVPIIQIHPLKPPYLQN